MPLNVYRGAILGFWAMICLDVPTAAAKYDMCAPQGPLFFQLAGLMPRNAKLWPSLGEYSNEEMRLRSVGDNGWLASLRGFFTQAIVLERWSPAGMSWGGWWMPSADEHEPFRSYQPALLPADAIVNIEVAEYDSNIAQWKTSDAIDTTPPAAPIIRSLSITETIVDPDRLHRVLPLDRFLWDVDLSDDTEFLELSFTNAFPSTIIVWKNDLSQFGNTACGPQVRLTPGRPTCIALSAFDVAGNRSPAVTYCTDVVSHLGDGVRTAIPVRQFKRYLVGEGNRPVAGGQLAAMLALVLTGATLRWCCKRLALFI
jgi:hypothetical protein